MRALRASGERADSEGQGGVGRADLCEGLEGLGVRGLTVMGGGES